MEYIPPNKVTSPLRQWSLISVLSDPREPGKCVLALGRWENKPVLAMRWNGTSTSKIGNPQSRGLPTWFIVDERFNKAIIGTLPKDVQDRAWNFLPGADALWLEDINEAMRGLPTDHWVITSSMKRDPNGENIVCLGFEDQLRHGREGCIDVELPEDSSHDDVKKKVKAALLKYFKNHPVTRGV